MPYIKNEPNLFPPNLFNDPIFASDNTPWWAMYTKARQEKKLAEKLCARSQPFFLPLRKKWRQSRPKRLVQEPLYSGYIFVATYEAREAALQTNCVSNMRLVNNTLDFFRQLADTHRLFCYAEEVLHEPTLLLNHRARIQRGPLQGIEGVVISQGRENRFAVILEFMGQGASMIIQPDQFDLFEFTPPLPAITKTA